MNVSTCFHWFYKEKNIFFFIKAVETCGNMLNLVLGPYQSSGNMYGNMWKHVWKTSIFMSTCMEHAVGRIFFSSILLSAHISTQHRQCLSLIFSQTPHPAYSPPASIFGFLILKNPVNPHATYLCPHSK